MRTAAAWQFFRPIGTAYHNSLNGRDFHRIAEFGQTFDELPLLESLHSGNASDSEFGFDFHPVVIGQRRSKFVEGFPESAVRRSFPYRLRSVSGSDVQRKLRHSRRSALLLLLFPFRRGVIRNEGRPEISLDAVADSVPAVKHVNEVLDGQSGGERERVRFRMAGDLKELLGVEFRVESSFFENRRGLPFEFLAILFVPNRSRRSVRRLHVLRTEQDVYPVLVRSGIEVRYIPSFLQFFGIPDYVLLVHPSTGEGNEARKHFVLERERLVLV